jgi:glutaredoxin-related protein
MNWKRLPLNTGQNYLSNTLFGGCEIYVPFKANATLVEVDKVRKELQNFIQWQEYECLHGDDIA